MPDSVVRLLDSNRILFELHQGNEIAQSCAGRLEPEAIAGCVTHGLVEKFDCAFARLWLLEPDQSQLKLVASAGMYTHTNGSFARVPMGAYKVGKIAQNRVAFLSNNLAAEPWVGNREWAIANNIRGFAGYPLLVKDRVIGVLAIFSHNTMEPEFLEVLQTLCTIVAIALDTACRYQREKQTWQVSNRSLTFSHLSLSDQLVSILTSARLTLVGTEHPLNLPVTYVLLQTAEILNRLACSYCRLIYTDNALALEAIVPTTYLTSSDPQLEIRALLAAVSLPLTCLGGTLQTQTNLPQRAIQVSLQIPYNPTPPNLRLRIHCRLPLLQAAFSHLAVLAGCLLWEAPDPEVPLLTDDSTQIASARRILWVQQDHQSLPRGVKGKVDLTLTAEQLQQAIRAVMQDQPWGLAPTAGQPTLSDRELEILTLLTQGHRDRDIADQLIISESTVKFHMNNVLTKLQVRTRYQAIHKAIVQGWI